MKDKLILDAGILLLLVLCMEYGATGPFLHELIGVILIIGMVTHFLINRKYYRILASGKVKKINTKSKIALAFNMILPVSLVTMFLSSVVISKDIFRFTGIHTSNYEAWRVLHIISACVMLITSVAHLLMHAKLFKSLRDKHVHGAVPGKILGYVSCLVAFLVGVYTVKTTGGLVADNIIASSENNKPQKIQPAETTEHKEYTEPYVFTEIPSPEENIIFTEIPFEEESIISENESEEYKEGNIIPENKSEEYEEETVITEQGEDKPSLEEYLGNLICTGCGKRCSLLAPRCGKGDMQAQMAADEYNQIYGLD